MTYLGTAYLDRLLLLLDTPGQADRRSALRGVLQYHDAHRAENGPRRRSQAPGRCIQTADAVKREAEEAAVIAAVCVACGYPRPDELLSTQRHGEVVRARRVAALVLRRKGRSLPAIGRVLRRDHSTILWALKRGNADPQVVALADEVGRVLG
jgi:hypothetical protein